MSSSQKYKIDHRYNAFKKIKRFLWFFYFQFYKSLNGD
jgi:hypothetical protein